MEVRAIARGRVQGVGFRYAAKTIADALHLTGYAQNLADGTVTLCLQGEQDAIAQFMHELRHKFPSAMIEDVPSASSTPSHSDFQVL